MMVGVTVVGTRLGELERGDIGKLSLPSFKDGELMARSEEVDKRPEEHKQPEEQGAAKKEQGVEQECSPFVLSEALPAVPAKLVKGKYVDMLKGKYVDMAELLSDNLEAERRRALADCGESGPRVGRREVRTCSVG